MLMGGERVEPISEMKRGEQRERKEALKMKFDASEGFRERGETDEGTEKLKPNMAIERGWNPQIKKKKKKDMHRLTYMVKSGTDIVVSWEQKQ